MTWIRKVVAYSIIFSLLLPLVHAANPFITKIKDLGNTFHELFGGFLAPDVMTKIAGGNQPALFWAKFLLWLLLFSLFFYLSHKFLFTDKKNISATIGAIVALISVVAIPTAVLVAIFQMYGFLVALIMYGGPILAIVLFANLINFPQNRRAEFSIKAILFFIIAALITAFNKAIAADQNFTFSEQYGNIGGWLEFVATILAIVYVFRAIFTGPAGGAAPAAGAPGGFGRFMNWINHGLGHGFALPGGGAGVHADPALVGRIGQLEGEVQVFRNHHQQRRAIMANILRMNQAAHPIPAATWGNLRNLDTICAQDGQRINTSIQAIQNNPNFAALLPAQRGRFRRAIHNWAVALGNATADDHVFVNRFAAVPAQGPPFGW